MRRAAPGASVRSLDGEGHRTGQDFGREAARDTLPNRLVRSTAYLCAVLGVPSCSGKPRAGPAGRLTLRADAP